jgi:hypothetical protein
MEKNLASQGLDKIEKGAVIWKMAKQVKDYRAKQLSKWKKGKDGH